MWNSESAPVEAVLQMTPADIQTRMDIQIISPVPNLDKIQKIVRQGQSSNKPIRVPVKFQIEFNSLWRRVLAVMMALAALGGMAGMAGLFLIKSSYQLITPEGEIGQVREMLRRGKVFHPHKNNPINAKTSYFYGYLMEYLSRLLGAHIVSGEYIESLSLEDQQRVYEDGYKIALYPLGNGWGFGEILDPDYAKAVFARNLTERTNEIITEAMQKEPDKNRPHVQIEVPEGFTNSDPKGAVVFGLLKGENRQESKTEWAFRSIVGCTTQVGTSRIVPWHLPVTNRGQISPEGIERLWQDDLDCPKDESPSFPSRLITPHELDPGLNKIRNDLSKCIKSGDSWFSQSPFHILLEKLFKPKLKELL